MPFKEYVRVVEEAFGLYARGKTLKPAMMHVDAVDGEFHIKAGGLELSRPYFALKANGGFFHNRERFGMPNIQGAILLCDGENGYPLAVMDSSEITMNRTGAAAAVAAKYLARPESAVVTICGCGTQGSVQLLAMQSMFTIQKAYVFDIDRDKAESLARDSSQTLGITVVATTNLEGAVRESDICVTCTPSRRYYLDKKYVSPGTFIAAMGADSPDKQELDPELLKSNKVVVDVLEQCARAGELHHALEKCMRKEEVHAELGEIVIGKKLGRTSKEEIVVFDATGTALQDVGAAAAVYEKALTNGVGLTFDFFG
jgi:ornithine cyclodeaminase/alanine dehydrogenase-like protein (mu-crystallin family)